MRILVCWDDAAQAELIRLYLNVDGNAVIVATEQQQFETLVQSAQNWDVIVVTTNFPDHDAAYRFFESVKTTRPECPVVAACHQEDVYRLARYLTSGLRAYLIRDEKGDFLFLMHAVIEGAVRQVEAERERLVAEKLRREIDSVRQLQESIIPHNIACPDRYEIVARYESSQIKVIGGQPVTMAGGDYYDAFTLPDDTTIVLVGDASGHGMKACMSIMTMHTLIRMIRFDEFRDPSNFVAYVNNMLCKQSVVNSEGGFITLLYGVLNPKTNEFQWASAGHPAPICHRLGSDSFETIGDDDSAGLPIGIIPEADYETHSFQIPEQSRLLLYTDGIIEAFPVGSEQHEEFGIGGLKRTMSSARELNLSQTMQKLFDDSQAFTRGQGRHDDTSVLLLERQG
ncbi:MAG: SpoIIE family protein phosphatase [Planctomycetaceae bacterium]|nr:SpoIIE family protein phosphatase [Planctomycetaceae bacterium]MCB9950929.1 SpoIIE family protein phosphatase [Planctomycetaceae bacterium]